MSESTESSPGHEQEKSPTSTLHDALLAKVTELGPLAAEKASRRYGKPPEGTGFVKLSEGLPLPFAIGDVDGISIASLVHDETTGSVSADLHLFSGDEIYAMPADAQALRPMYTLVSLPNERQFIANVDQVPEVEGQDEGRTYLQMFEAGETVDDVQLDPPLFLTDEQSLDFANSILTQITADQVVTE